MLLREGLLVERDIRNWRADATPVPEALSKARGLLYWLGRAGGFTAVLCEHSQDVST
jgi:hypothetical protein